MTLSLSVSTGNQQEYRLSNEHYRIIKEADYTCQYCGFQSVPCPEKDASSFESQGYMQVHSLSYSTKKSATDLKCVCPFCYQTLNLTIVENPTFIYFPWITQEQLNHLMIVIFSMIRMGTQDEFLANQATKCYLKLLHYKNYAVQIHSSIANDPKELIQVLYWLSREDSKTYKNRDIFLGDVRLIPIEPPQCSGFQRYFSYWNTYKWYQDDMKDKWLAIYNNIMSISDPVQKII